MKFLFAAGRTGGTLTPGLATFQYLRSVSGAHSFLVVGDDSFHARELCKKEGVAYQTIPTAKITRYFSLQNLLAPFKLVAAYFKSRKIIKAFRPDVVFGAGGYSEVPVILAAYTLGIPSVIHQQDVLPVRSNLVSKWFASEITVTFDLSQKDFWVNKNLLKNSPKPVTTIGNPTSQSRYSITKSEALARFGLSSDKPVLLVFGGGTGSVWLNKMITSALGQLLSTFNVLHITGKGSKNDLVQHGYKQLEFESEMSYAYTCADLVVCRGGLGTLTELSVFQKPAVVVPLPNSPQVANAAYAEEQGAVITIHEQETSPEAFVLGVRKLWENKELLIHLKTKIKNILPSGASQKLADILLSYGQKS